MKSVTEFDVAVVGGGPAGVAAATAASVCGAGRVVLIEATPGLGGSVSAAMHRCLCGLYAQAPDSPTDTLNDGIQRQVVSELVRLDPSSVIPRQLGLTWVLEFPAPAYVTTLNQLCDRAKVHRMMSTRLTGVHRANSSISAIQINSEQWISVGAVVDCSGAGTLLQMVGEDVMLPPDPQRMLGGYSIRLAGLTGDPEMLRLKVPYVLALGVAAGQLPPEAKLTLLHPGPGPGEAVCKMAVHPKHFSGAGNNDFAEKILACLKSQIDGFAHAVAAEASQRPLPRDGRRIKGTAVVTESDVLEGRQLGTDAVHAWWPIEQWDISQGPSYAYPPAALHYDISASAMQSDVIENLFAAGTCVSATQQAAASLRASGICLATGEAAGKLAAKRILAEKS